MTLYEIITELLNIASKQPNINYVGEGDIYSLNTLPNIDYSVFFITQSNHQQGEDLMTYNLTLYYLDRLAESSKNVLQIQSTAMLMLGNIINVFNQMNQDVQINYDIDYTTFTHRLKDDCAGVFANVSISVDNEIGVCGYE